jgi:hypothetical protein
VGSGAVIDADGTGFVNYRRNWKTLYSKLKNKGLEKQLRGAVAGCEVCRRDTVRRQHEDTGCLVLGDSIVQNVESDHVRVQCFPGIRTAKSDGKQIPREP